MGDRIKSVTRKTFEADISININIDGKGQASVNTGIGFMDHMLTSLLVHGRFDGDIKSVGDTHVDYHHSVEDIGIVLGMAFKDALSNKKGLKRFGTSFVPMDESLVLASIDVSGRPYLVFDCAFPTQKVGEMDTELFEEFFRAFAFNAGITLHLKLFHGSNSHHIAEALFKAAARALQEACSIDSRFNDILSTKGTI